MSTKRQRQHVIGQLLADHPVSSQAQLVELLEAEGIEFGICFQERKDPGIEQGAFSQSGL